MGQKQLKNKNFKCADHYHIDRWSDGYFYIDVNGHLCALPHKNKTETAIDFLEIIHEAKKNNLQFPFVLRFHDILRSQVKRINTVFNQKIKKANYKGKYFGVYPIKVNQMREVVEEIIDAGKEFNFGLEAGSKAELMSVLALNDNKNSLTILNGYKDYDYLKLALLGLRLGQKIIVVIEKFTELEKLISISKKLKIKPIIGLRAKINTEGCGRWADSTGEKAKFGLTMVEIINCVELLKKHDLVESLKLLHFHVGSQIPDIRTIIDSVKEGARIYCELRKLKMPISYLDVGGGLGIDYDGSQSISHSSRNYDFETYASDIIYGIKEVCDLENINHPHIVSESGRAITAHHSCVITEVVEKIDSKDVELVNLDSKTKNVHHLVSRMQEISEYIKIESILESYTDALSVKNDSENAFRLGVLSLKELAIIETEYWKIVKKLNSMIPTLKHPPKEFEKFSDLLSSQYLCNLSVFQSLPDTWAIDQLLPIVPLQRLNENPTENVTLVDITCDSDGKINQYINLGETKNTITLHTLKNNEPYYIGFFLTGAYQDVMGDMHNLFGRLSEIHVFYDEDSDNNYYLEEIIHGARAKDVLSQMQYNPQQMAYVIKKLIQKKVQEKKIGPREGVQLIDFYEECLEGHTYLRS